MSEPDKSELLLGSMGGVGLRIGDRYTTDVPVRGFWRRLWRRLLRKPMIERRTFVITAKHEHTADVAWEAP